MNEGKAATFPSGTEVAALGLDERIALCSGADFWHTKGFPEHGIPSVLLSDGPHGLRKQRESSDHLGLFDSVATTCFPTASATGCSWDRDLLREIGGAIGEEALQEDVAVVLGPSVNLHRNPLNGRHFEYFSEDPLLTGELAAAWTEGLQSRGVGACVKHFAANSQESLRMTSDSVVDERTLRELYLSAFERIVKRAKPLSVMTAYNQLNGTACSANARLLRTILREEWGFDGVTVSDWGGTYDRVAAFEAGLDLEMPGGASYFDAEVREAVERGSLSSARVDESAARVAALARYGADRRRPGFRYDPEAHHALARRAAVESAVLLKNDGGLLPLARGVRVAVVGELAAVPRYQGAGSSRIVPTRLVTPLDGLASAGVAFDHAAGYRLDGRPDAARRDEALAVARAADVVVVFAGLPDASESEGFDRTDLRFPDEQGALIEALADVNPDLVVVLAGGSSMEMPWIGRAKAVLHLHLPGQAGGEAVADLLTGAANPSGKLSTTEPVRCEDLPSSAFFAKTGTLAEYREGLYVGYRFFDKAGVAPRFAFGHGLSYTRFTYRDLRLETLGAQGESGRPTRYGDLVLDFVVRNDGPVDGAEVAQVYVGSAAARTGGQGVHRPERELRGFEKVRLAAGEEKRIRIRLDRRAFAWYDPMRSDWVVPEGAYRILVGSSSRDIRLEAEVRITGDEGAAEPSAPAPWYSAPGRTAPTRDEFERLLGRRIASPVPHRRGTFTAGDTLWEMRRSLVVRLFLSTMERTLRKGHDASVSDATYRMMVESVRHSPLRSLSLNGPKGMTRGMVRGLVDLANGHFRRGLKEFLSALPKPAN